MIVLFESCQLSGSPEQAFACTKVAAEYALKAVAFAAH